MRKPTFGSCPLRLFGYWRVWPELDRQNTDLPRDALLSAGIAARHLFEDHASGVKEDRPGQAKVLEFVCSDDALLVWKLEPGFRSLTEGMDTTTASRECGLTSSPP